MNVTIINHKSLSTIISRSLVFSSRDTPTMADALCGSSNPLQNFQKYSQADRTLQQDRLTSRGSPAQVRCEACDTQIVHTDYDFRVSVQQIQMQARSTQNLKPFNVVKRTHLLSLNPDRPHFNFVRNIFSSHLSQDRVMHQIGQQTFKG